MRAVVDGYRADGVFERCRIELLDSHVEGSTFQRVAAAGSALARFLGLLFARQVSLVHCHAAMRGSFWRKSVFAMLARSVGVPVVFHLHGSEFKQFVGAQPAPLKGLIAWVLKRQSVVLVLSESWRGYVLSLAPGARVQVLPNYVSLPDLSHRPSPGQAGRTNVLFLGAVGQRKGVFDLLHAMVEVLRREAGVSLVIGGNGEVERAQQLAQELGIARAVSFAGWVSGEEKQRLLREADLCVLPSYNEGLPVSLLEAMAWGVPVISTRVGGIPELIDEGVDGLLIEPGDRKAIADAIAGMVSDAAGRHRMGHAARKKVASAYSRDCILPRLEAIYSELIQTGSTTAGH